MNNLEQCKLTRDLLSLVSIKVTLKDIKTWSVKKRDKACDWAGAVHLKASDNIVEVPKKPSFLPKESKFEPKIFNIDFF